MIEHSFNSNEKLKRRKKIEQLYARGKTIYSGDRKLKADYILDKDQRLPGTRVTVAVAKKSGKAVWRNKAKRLMRESYRLNKQNVIELCIEKKFHADIIFSLHNINEQKKKKISLRDIQPGIIELLKKICGEL